MKYIRTKDKIMYGFNYHFIEIGNEKLRKILPNLEKDEIIKQADTIEELCDEFVVYVKDNKLLTYLGTFESCYNWYNELKDRKGASKVEVSMFGAIWTDWGLKYVAKMNEEGELELL